MNILTQFKQIQTFIFGIDGVLTDGSILVTEKGESLRQLNIKDEFALQLAIKEGYRIVFLSRGNPEGIKIRLNTLGITDIFLGVDNKKQKLDDLARQYRVAWEQVLCMGHDMPDYFILKTAGLSCCPADGSPEIKQISKYVSTFRGGAGCVRDVIEKVLKLNGHWEFN